MLTSNYLPLCAVVCTVFIASPALVRAQAGSDLNPSGLAVSGASSQNKSCSVFALQSAPTLTLEQRGCFFARQLFSPQFAMSASLMATFDQSVNSPWVKHERWDKFPHRFEIYYARNAARDAAELVVGYFHHEDPRLHKSSESGFWRRTNAALLSVVTSPDEDGHLRPAFAPVAGSLSSAFTGTLMYRHSETLPTTMIKAGGVYAFYFVRAVFAEFKPEFDSMIHRILN